jgi:tetratricopeptide (TPR) repeat protein
VRINLQLIDAATDSYIWADTCDRDLNNVFTVESEVATQVADALKVKLLPAETKRLAKVPTRNPQAHDALLRGDASQARAESSNLAADFDTAIAAYREATKHDPQFALAWAHLAYSLLWKPWNGLTNDMPVAREQSRAAAQRALTLAPDRSQAHVAMGFYYYWGMHDFAHGMEEFDRALALNPRDAIAQQAVGQIRMRQGRLDEAIAACRRAIELDPRSPRPLLMLVMAYGNQRHYDLADQTLLRMLDLDPANADAIGQRAGHRWLATGDPHQAIAILDAAPASVRANPNIVAQRTQLQYYLGDFKPARRFFASADADVFPAMALCQARADIEWATGNRTSSRATYQRCVKLIQSDFAHDPDNPYFHNNLGWIYARLGRAEDAMHEGQRAVDLWPVAQDWTQGGDQLLGMAKIRAQLGQVDAAVAILDQLLSSPHGEIV